MRAPTSSVCRLILLLITATVLLNAASAPTSAESLRPAAIALQSAAAGGDLVALRAAHEQFAAAWPAAEDALRSKHRATYVAIEEALGDLGYALQPDSQDPAAAAMAARHIADLLQPLLSAPAATAPVTTNGPPTVTSLLEQIAVARAQHAAGDGSGARTTFTAVRRAWPDVEGAVKIRNSTAYRDIEDLLARAGAELKADDPQADATLTRLTARLTPFVQLDSAAADASATGSSSYGASDIMLLLLREGIEALLVVTALLTFLKRSGHADKQRYIWLGASVGVAISVVLAFTAQLVFKAAFSGADREVVEGVVGLVAAGLLFWVSWWLHRAASLSRWNAAIADRTQAALAAGSVASLTALAFLAVVREGAETALFFLGMAPAITTADLLLGLALGSVALALCGVLFVRLGTRLPLRPFFAMLGILILAMGVKFVGAGIHALQIAQWVPSSVIPGLSSISALGFFPTWESTFGQAAAVLLAVGLLRFGARTTPAKPSVLSNAKELSV